MFDFSFFLQILQSAELILRREFGIDAMELEQIDAIEAQALEAAFAGGTQMFGFAVHGPFVGAGAVEAGFGGDDQILGIGVKGFGDDFFADVRAVGIGGVDKINSQGNGAAKDLDGFGTIFGLAPNSLAGN